MEDLIKSIQISDVAEAEEILKAAGSEDLFEKAKWNVGDTKVYQGVTYEVGGFNAKGTPLWRKKKDGGGGKTVKTDTADKPTTNKQDNSKTTDNAKPKQGKYKLGDTKVYQGITYEVGGFNDKGTPLWRKKKDTNNGTTDNTKPTTSKQDSGNSDVKNRSTTITDKAEANSKYNDKSKDFNPAKEIKKAFPLKDIKLYKASKIFSDDRYLSRYNQNVLFATIPVKKSKYWTKPEVDIIIEAIQHDDVTYFSVEFYNCSRARGIIVTSLENIEEFAQYMTSGYTTKKEYEMKDYGDGEIQKIEHENVVEKPMPRKLKMDIVNDDALRKTLVKLFYEEYEREVYG